MAAFAELKAKLNIEDVARHLGLELSDHGKQWRSPCKKCKIGGEKAIVITPEKSAWYCFPAKQGGDIIALTSHILGISQKDAGNHLAPLLGKPVETEDKLEPLQYLEMDHECFPALGISKETCFHFGAGYAPKGIMRGRLAIPIHDLNGKLVAYCGRAVKEDQTPMLIFPKGFDPSLYVFNLHRMETDCVICDDPLQVLQAYEHGVETVVAWLHKGQP